MTKKLRVAAYARVSTDKDDQANSLDNQRTYFSKYIVLSMKFAIFAI